MELWKLFGFSNYLQNKQIKDHLIADSNKPKCPHCGGPSELGYSRCKNCGQEIAWEGESDNKFLSANMISETLNERIRTLADESGIEKLRKELIHLDESGQQILMDDIHAGDPSCKADEKQLHTVSETSDNDSPYADILAAARDSDYRGKSDTPEGSIPESNIHEGLLRLAYYLDVEGTYQSDNSGYTIYNDLQMSFDIDLPPHAAIWECEQSFRVTHGQDDEKVLEVSELINPYLTPEEHEKLNKDTEEALKYLTEPCPCGSGKIYRECCIGK
jgi:hypothetical protein